MRKRPNRRDFNGPDRDGIGDYDCVGGSGNGPNYVPEPIVVRAPDPFGLDADHNGIGCE